MLLPGLAKPVCRELAQADVLAFVTGGINDSGGERFENWTVVSISHHDHVVTEFREPLAKENQHAVGAETELEPLMTDQNIHNLRGLIV
jgi:hypothetical protein